MSLVNYSTISSWKFYQVSFLLLTPHSKPCTCVSPSEIPRLRRAWLLRRPRIVTIPVGGLGVTATYGGGGALLPIKPRKLNKSEQEQFVITEDLKAPPTKDRALARSQSAAWVLPPPRAAACGSSVRRPKRTKTKY